MYSTHVELCIRLQGILFIYQFLSSFPSFNAQLLHTSRYLNDLPYIDHPYFEQMVSQIYPLNCSKIRRIHQILTWNCSLLIRIVSSTIYDFKRDDFKIEIVNFPFLDGVVPRSPSYGVYISQRIHFTSLRVSFLILMPLTAKPN